MQKIFRLIFLLSTSWIAVSGQTWKQSATDSILKYRTAPLSVHVTDESGSPAENVLVRVKMHKHEFLWGTTVSITEIIRLINSGKPIGSHYPYYSHFRYFNSVTPANAGKWKGWLDTQQRSTYLKTIDWFEELGIANRGHTCVWESERFNAIPDFLKTLNDTSLIRGHVKSHITEQLTVLKEHLYEVDVVNELVHEQHITRDLLNLSDPALEHSKWYKWAHNAAPDVNLIANEFDLFQSGNNFYNNYRSYITKMIDDGAPVHGVGMQGHFWTDMPSYEELKTRIERIKVLGLPMEVTEFDMKGVAYEDMERVLYAVFSEPQIYNFTVWGAWDGAQWRNNGPLFYENWNLKPSGQAWMDLVRGQWWTDTLMRTDASGSMEIDAFKGDYSIEIHFNNKVFIDSFTVGDEAVSLQYSTIQAKSAIPEAEIFITNPQNEYNVFQPVNIKVETNFPDSVKEVEFYEKLLISHIDSEPPFVFQTTSTGVGKRYISARIVCKNGYSFFTDSVHFSFVNKNAFPIIKEAYPFSNQFFMLGTDIPVSCVAEDYDQGIWKVELSGVYPDSILIDSVPPFNMSISNPDAGNYKIEMKAFDSLYAFDRKIITFTVFDPDAQNLSITGPEAADHDVEENESGIITLEGDLDIGDKICGIYFQNAGIPKNAIIDSAFIQFTCDRTSTGIASIPIYAELNPSAVGFNTNDNNLTNRLSTKTIVWYPPEWIESGERGVKQKTPDIKAVIRELQEQEDWSEESSVVFLSGFAPEGNRRRAISFDINPNYAPQLNVYYKGGFDLSPPQPPNNLILSSGMDNSVELEWEKPGSADIIGYFLYINGKRFNQIPVKTTHLTLTELSSDSLYRFYVTAINNLSIESGQSNIVEKFKTGNNERKTTEVQVYPNPFTENLSIILPSNHEVKKIRLINNAGQIVFEQTISGDDTGITLNNRNMHCPVLHAGIYLLQLQSTDKLQNIIILKTE